MPPIPIITMTNVTGRVTAWGNSTTGVDPAVGTGRLNNNLRYDNKGEQWGYNLSMSGPFEWLGRSHELRAYVRGAVNNGAGWVEIREVLLHAGVYAGAPAAVEGFRVARAVLLEMGISLAEEPPAA